MKAGRRPGNWGALATVVLLLTGCTFVEEILNMRSVEVVDYFPSQAAVAPEAVDSVWVEFSTEMDRSQAENAFSLSENGKTLEGRFTWSAGGRRLSFAPGIPIRRARRYGLRVTVEAEDLYGNSLDRELNVSFSTGTESLAPEVVTFSPADGAVLADPLTPVELIFSEAIDRENFYRAFSIDPHVAGAFSWTAGDAGVTFSPLESYVPGVDYTVQLETDVTDTSGNGLVRPVVIGFRLPAEEELEAVSVARFSDGAPLSEEATIFLNRLPVEKDDAFRIVFTRVVPIERRPGIVRLEPSVSEWLDWEDSGGSVVVVPRETMSWMAVHELVLGSNRYRFRITGEGSRPPKVLNAYFASSLGEGSFSPLSLGNNVDFVTSDDSAVDIVVSHSAEAGLLFASAMEAAEITASQGAPMSFVIRDIELRHTHPEGGALPAGRTAIRLHLSVEAETPGGGIVTLQVGTELTDSRSNSLPEEWSLEVNGF